MKKALASGEGTQEPMLEDEWLMKTTIDIINENKIIINGGKNNGNNMETCCRI